MNCKDPQGRNPACMGKMPSGISKSNQTAIAEQDKEK
jgi:hypothetical protein